jgi:hypothetical protein
MEIMRKQSAQHVFAHPIGAFPLSIKPRHPDELYRALIRANASYIMLAADHLDEESRDIALDFVEIADEVTDGVVKLPQRIRELSRFEFGEIHADLLKRGCNVLGGRVAIAIRRQPRDESGTIMGEWTERIEVAAIVITRAEISDAMLLMPPGSVASRDEGHIEPTYELPWSD